MSGSVYGGDDVGAIVFDIGSFTTKCGYAGEEFPKCEMPSCVGKLLPNFVSAEESDITVSAHDEDVYIPPRRKKHSTICGYNNMSLITSSYQLKELYNDDSTLNIDVFEEMLNYMYESVLHTVADTHPVLFTEPFDNFKKNKDQMTEMMFEKFNSPAISICKAPVLASFANGRTTSLVVDMGHNRTSICPVSDGYCLTKACATLDVCGSFLLKQTESLLNDTFQVDLTPMPCIKNRQLRNVEEAPIFTLKPDYNQFDPNWITYQRMLLVNDFQLNTFRVSDYCVASDSDNSQRVYPITSTEYQFPTGYRMDLTKKFHNEHHSFMIPELYFNEELQKYKNVAVIKSLQAAIDSVVDNCDIDMKACLMNNIILYGGCSSISGMSDRLYNELSAITSPTIKIKVLSPNNSAEKRFSAWIGGSILASLGSFQQLWISPLEYKELGPNCIDLRSVT